MAAGKIRVKRALLIGISLTAALTFFIGLSPLFIFLLGILAVRGITAGIPGGLCRPLLGHFYPGKRGKIININEAAWAVGATGGPIFAILIKEFASWRFAYFILSLFLIPIVLVMWITDFPRDTIREETVTLGKLGVIMKNPAIIGIFLALFFNVGVEGSFFLWLPSYLYQSFPEYISDLALAGFLGTYVPGRLFNSFLSEREDNLSLAFLNAAIVVFLLFFTFFLTSGYLTLVFILAVGFFISGVFPNLYTASVELFPENSGPINGLIMVFDPLGLSIIPAAIGFIAETQGLGIAMKFLVAPMIVTVAVTLLLRLTCYSDG